jgi:chemotaxis protein MotB
MNSETAQVEKNSSQQKQEMFKKPLEPTEEEATVDDIAEEEGAPAWMVTFADLVTLLLVFFVLLFSISSIEKERFKSVLSSIQIALNQNSPAVQQIVIQQSPAVNNIQPETTAQAIIPEEPTQDSKKENESDRKNLIQDLEQMILQQRLGNHVYVYTEGDRIIIRIKGTILFPSGDVELFAEAEPIFEDIRSLFEKYSDYQIAIKGHTDDQPITTARFPSNWELSAVRATTVLRYFIDEGIDAGRMSATGYSSLFPIASNATEEGRAQNRRVEFVLEKQQ